MGIREKINEKPAVAGTVVGVVIVLAIVWIYFQNRSPNTGPAAAAEAAFYSEDDGQTYFAGEYANLGKDFKGPNGKEAVRAYVFRYGREKPFVGYLEKFTPAGKQIVSKFYADPANAKLPPPPEAVLEVLVKKPGEKNWVSMKDRGAAVMVRSVPPRSDQPAQIVQP